MLLSKMYGSLYKNSISKDNVFTNLLLNISLLHNSKHRYAPFSVDVSLKFDIWYDIFSIQKFLNEKIVGSLSTLCLASFIYN